MSSLEKYFYNKILPITMKGIAGVMVMIFIIAFIFLIINSYNNLF